MTLVVSPTNTICCCVLVHVLFGGLVLQHVSGQFLHPLVQTVQKRGTTCNLALYALFDVCSRAATEAQQERP
ncbi:hypothetical protein BsWGS_01757 [Bradybaena similaris]